MKFKNIKKNQPAGGKKTQSPSNSRIIPASSKPQRGETEKFKFPMPQINPTKLFGVYGKTLRVFVVFSFIVTVIIVGFDFQKNLQTKRNIDKQREILTKELNFWIGFLAKNQNYPDAYFQASILEYKLGDSSKAKMYVEKGLALDPNSENGRKIEQLLK